MAIKGIVLGTYALALGTVLLLSNSGVVTGLGAMLVGLTAIAAVTHVRLRRPSRLRD
ncbi:hypothetical protein [Halobellus clavatus]|jgi:hypothetical protein|uniref:Uncharacterized protein n=1 Tax=Halobellus clavatus TaxID=660517 RepID=A0A1H3EA94_9EURY|nr:hypothetical protein [Halobellus clavatus]SDX75682.1 hypothetical protein SAMN04487946_102143 [Halobellus clavatus]